MNDDQLIVLGRSVSIEQAGQLLGLSRRSIYNRIADGRLVTIRTLGGSQRVLVESLVTERGRKGKWQTTHRSKPTDHADLRSDGG